MVAIAKGPFRKPSHDAFNPMMPSIQRASGRERVYRLTSSVSVVMIAISIVCLAVYLPFLDQFPLVVTDEPWYANTAHNFANGNGLVNTVVGRGGGDRFFLYTVILSEVFSIFGTSLWVGRLVSVVIGLTAVWGWALLGRRLGIHGWAFIITTGLFLFSNINFIIFRRVRPEVLVIALSVWAIYFFIDAWQHHRFSSGLVSALLTGASMLAHPNGALLALTFGAVLIARIPFDTRNLRPLFGYIVGGVGVTILMLLMWQLLLQQGLIQFFRETLIESRRISVGSTSSFSIFSRNLTAFVPAYTLGSRRLYIFLFEVGILLFGLCRYRVDRVTCLLSLSGLLWFIAGLSLLTPFFRWAFAIVPVFSLAVTGRLLSAEVTPISVRTSKTLWLLALLYASNTVAGDAYALSQNIRNTAYTEVARTLNRNVPDGVPILTHIELWFAFQRNRVHTAFSYEDVDMLLTSGHIQYAVLSAALSKPSSLMGQPERLNNEERFYHAARDYFATHGRRTFILATQGYGEIEIWELCRHSGKCDP